MTLETRISGTDLVAGRYDEELREVADVFRKQIASTDGAPRWLCTTAAGSSSICGMGFATAMVCNRGSGTPIGDVRIVRLTQAAARAVKSLE